MLFYHYFDVSLEEDNDHFLNPLYVYDKKPASFVRLGEVSRPMYIYLCYAAASPLCAPLPIKFSCATSKVFLI